MEQQPIVWRPDTERARRTHTRRFMDRHHVDSYSDLLARSISEPDWFWQAVVEHLGIPFHSAPSVIRDTGAGKPWTTWFTDGSINLADVCVDRWSDERPEQPAVVGERESGETRTLTFAELADAVGSVAAGLRSLGVRHGDPVAVFLPMSAEAIVAFLALARLGAIFIPVFSGYLADAVATRLADPRPKAVICADGFTRRGKPVAMKEIADTAIELAGGIEAVVVVEYAGRTDTPWTEGRDHRWTEVMAHDPVPSVATAAEDPVLIAYTSGTTGRPKGAIHVHGGLTVKLAQEGAFQADLHPGDRLTWITDMGWIMGPWMTVAGLANGATVIAFDGAPDYPGPERIWSLVERHRLGFLGISPTLIRALQPHGSALAHRHDLSSLRGFGSTGEAWNPDPWWWLFRDVGRERVPIVNISGGTEIGACILSVNLLQGIKPTSVGGPSLGMAADVYDNEGRPLRGAVGELVVTQPWPGMTRGFYGEPDRYLETYWRRFEGVWVHGDWASIDADGFWFLHGRSDDTLNIAGKRVGPAEIESAAVTLDEIVMAAAVGVPDELKGEVVLVVAVPAPGIEPTSELATRVADTVSAALGRAFRPKDVVFAEDLPRTRSAKIMRRVVRALAVGTETGDLSSLENPDSLDSVRRSLQ